MPDLGLKLHDGRPERVLVRDLHIDHVGSALVWGIRRTGEGGRQVGNIVVSPGLGVDARLSVFGNIAQLLSDATGSVRGSHFGTMGSFWSDREVRERRALSRCGRLDVLCISKESYCNWIGEDVRRFTHG